jgi:hypothetical protein
MSRYLHLLLSAVAARIGRVLFRKGATALTFVLVMIVSRAILWEHIPLWRTPGTLLIIGRFVPPLVAGE